MYVFLILSHYNFLVSCFEKCHKRKLHSIGSRQSNGSRPELEMIKKYRRDTNQNHIERH